MALLRSLKPRLSKILLQGLRHAEPFDCLTQNVDAFVKLMGGNELTGAMRDADVARTKDNGVRAEHDHAWRFGAKSHGARRVAGCLFEKLNQKRIRARFETLVCARRVDLANEI